MVEQSSEEHFVILSGIVACLAVVIGKVFRFHNRIRVLLIVMGIDKLSMSPAVIPEISKFVVSISLEEARLLAGNIMKLSTSTKIKSYISREGVN